MFDYAWPAAALLATLPGCCAEYCEGPEPELRRGVAFLPRLQKLATQNARALGRSQPPGLILLWLLLYWPASPQWLGRHLYSVSGRDSEWSAL